MDRTGRSLILWTSVILFILLVILVPFFLFETGINRYIDGLIEGGGSRALLAAVLSGFLAADVFLPVPSSLVSTASGALFGLPAGTLVSWIGMTAGCLIGYLVGLKAGAPLIERLAGRSELDRAERARERYGAWTIILFRAVPVLAEVSVLLAGLSRMPAGRFLLLSALSNLGISAAYAAVGAMAYGSGAFLIAFAGAILLPAAAMGVVRLLRS